MNYTQSDIAALKAADVLQAYCERTLGQGKRVGGKMFYPCPYGAHTRLKLEVTDKNGCGLALCRACNRGGSVFDVAAGVLGVDPRKDFAACVEAVADAVGYNLTPDDGTAPKKGRRSRKAGFSRPLAVPARPVPDTPAEKPLEYLPPDEEAAALAAVERLRNAPRLMADFAAMLGLPLGAIRSHTDMSLAVRGLLGVDERGHMVYVYTHCLDDAAPVRVLNAKVRNKPAFPPYVSMGGKSYDKLWGADEIPNRDSVWIAEGETDALAVRAAVEAWHDIALHTVDHYNPKTFPAVVGRPGTSTFKDHWADELRGKEVTILSDKGIKKVADKLKAAGVRRVFAWMPPGELNGRKSLDARDCLDVREPHLLATDIYRNRKDISQIELEQNGQTTK